MKEIEKDIANLSSEFNRLTHFGLGRGIEDTPLSIYTYHGFMRDTEVTYIRYELPEQTSKTFVIETAFYDRFIEGLLEELSEKGSVNRTIKWSQGQNGCYDMAELGYQTIVSRLPIEYPLDWIKADTTIPSPLDGMTNGDFIELDNTIGSFREEFAKRLSKVTALAMDLKRWVKVKDHDLYLSFKGVENFAKINVGLDRVYPRLPESGEFELGDRAINPDDWKDYPREVQVIVKRISHATKQINRVIDDARGRVATHPITQKAFADELKIQLMSSSHFMKQIYTFNKVDGRKQLEEAANDIMKKLADHGGNIGLDLNSWIVYNYDVEGRPEAITEGELNFKDHLYNRYTISFVEELYAFLLQTPNPYIKPYNYREVVTEDDGIPLGSIRQVK